MKKSVIYRHINIEDKPHLLMLAESKSDLLSRIVHFNVEPGHALEFIEVKNPDPYVATPDVKYAWTAKYLRPLLVVKVNKQHQGLCRLVMGIGTRLEVVSVKLVPQDLEKHYVATSFNSQELSHDRESQSV